MKASYRRAQLIAKPDQPAFLFQCIESLIWHCPGRRKSAHRARDTTVLRYYAAHYRRRKQRTHPVEKELQFLRNTWIFSVRRFAMEKQSNIKSLIEWDENPLLCFRTVVNFIENAFKHGVSQHHDFFIHVYLYCRQGKLELFLTTVNITTLQKPDTTSIGMANVKSVLRFTILTIIS